MESVWDGMDPTEAERLTRAPEGVPERPESEPPSLSPKLRGDRYGVTIRHGLRAYRPPERTHPGASFTGSRCRESRGDTGFLSGPTGNSSADEGGHRGQESDDLHEGSHCHTRRNALRMVKWAAFLASSPAQASTSSHYKASTAVGCTVRRGPGRGTPVARPPTARPTQRDARHSTGPTTHSVPVSASECVTVTAARGDVGRHRPDRGAADPLDPAVTLANWWATPSRRRARSVQAYVWRPHAVHPISGHTTCGRTEQATRRQDSDDRPGRRGGDARAGHRGPAAARPGDCSDEGADRDAEEREV